MEGQAGERAGETLNMMRACCLVKYLYNYQYNISTTINAFSLMLVYSVSYLQPDCCLAAIFRCALPAAEARERQGGRK